MGPGTHLGGWVLTLPQRSPRSRVTHTDIWIHGRRQKMQIGGRILAMLVVAMGLVVPATASAVPTAKVTDDGGNPVVLTAGAPLALRNMDVKAFGNIAPGDGLGFTVAVTGPDGLPAT